MTKEQWRKREEQWKKFHDWEHRQAQRNRLTPRQAFRIFEELRREAVSLGVLGRSVSLQGLEAEFRIAAFLNGLPRRV